MVDLRHSPDPSDPDAVLAWAEACGVDLSMLRERLAMTPTERILRHQGALKLAMAFREAGREDRRVQSRTSDQRAV